MDSYKRKLVEIANFKKGFCVSLGTSVFDDILESIIFCIFITVLVIGEPTGHYQGLASWVFESVYPYYDEMDSNIINYFPTVYSVIKSSVVLSVSLIVALSLWFFIAYKPNVKSINKENIINIMLYCFRYFFSLQIISFIILPVISINVMDNTFLNNRGLLRGYDPFFLLGMKGSLVTLSLISLTLTIIFLAQIKSVISFLQCKERHWFLKSKNKISLGAVIPLFLGLLISSNFSSFMKTNNVVNKKAFNKNSCVYIKDNPEIFDHNLQKVTRQEKGCHAFERCYKYSDSSIRNKCMDKIYNTSTYFKYKVKTDPAATCEMKRG